MLLAGITVSEAIEKLKTCDPKAILVGHGEFGIFALSAIKNGEAFRHENVDGSSSIGIDFSVDTEESLSIRQPVVLLD